MENKQGEPEALTLAKQALENIDQERFPKRYQLQEELIKQMELAFNYKIRAEKAEKKVKKTSVPLEGTPKKPEEEETPKFSNYSLKDIRALSGVHDEDVERVEKFAKTENISIGAALENDDLKAILRNRDEQRKIAAAVNTGGGKRGTSKVTGEELLDEAVEGKFPESDESWDKIAEARLKKREENR